MSLEGPAVHRITLSTHAGPPGPSAEELQGLAEVLVDCVAGGASVGFMVPLTVARALAFWQGIAQAVQRHERALVLAKDAANGRVLGTVQLVLALPENQPHRADLVKMLVHRDARCQGLGQRLMLAAEQAAQAAGKQLLVLDTATPEAERLYRRAGWLLAGEIPRFALLPEGGLCATRLFYKELISAESSPP
jgi:GNAT superfamily N-acetyltransferase